MKFGIIRFPGSNCDDDALHALTRVLGSAGLDARIVWHKDVALGAVDGVLLPGGFSYGDYLRAGAMAAHSPIMGAVKTFADKGGPVLAVCNGFQIACEAGLLPGALAQNESLKFECRDVHLRVEGRPTPFTKAIPAGRILKMSIAHHEGRYVHSDVDKLEQEGLVAFRYVTPEGEVAPSANPNGSIRGIAGVTNPRGNVVGLMPHPERAVEALLGGGGEDGRALFLSAVASLRGEPARVGR
jgi:phosphoribosylformylglycinamidine synthase subunit PurQ / glutaminase